MTPKLLFTTLLTALFTTTTAASAQTPGACDAPMSRIQLGAAVGDVTDALAVQELIEARETLDEIHDKLPCLEEVVDTTLLAMFARYNAIVYSYGQEEDLARKWALTARQVDPGLKWNEQAFPPDNPVRQMVDLVPIPAPARLGGKQLAPPRGGGVFTNGAFAARPEASPGAQILVQVFDKSGERVDAYWQEGPAFRAQWVVSGDEDQKPPGWWSGGTAPAGTGAVAIGPAVAPAPAPSPKPRPLPPPKPQRPPSDFPVVPVVGAGLLTLLAGGSYGLAYVTKQQLDPADPQSVAGIRTRANTLVLVSGASLAGAVGIGIGGAVVSANGVTVRF